MKVRTLNVQLGGLVALLALAGCGGGSDSVSPPTDLKGVAVGYQAVSGAAATGQPWADFDQKDNVAMGSTGGRTGTHPLGCNFSGVPRITLPAGQPVGDGTNGSGGIGVGGAPGRFIDVEITVTFPDAKEIGRAMVDNATGMVTVYPGKDYTGGLIVTARGTATGKLFDPGTNTYQPFTAQDSWRAYVDAIRGNIAVSPITEAAARYVDQNQVYTETAFREANEIIAQEINECLPAAFRLHDITRLAQHTLNERSGITSVVDEFSGRQTIAIAGLIRSFGADLSGITGSPAMAFTGYLGQELLDLKIDGKRNGQPIAMPGAPTGAFIADSKFFSRVKWAIDQTWAGYRDPAYAPLLDAQTATYDCYEWADGVSQGGTDANGNPVATRQGTLKYFPVTNAVQLDGVFEFSATFSGAKEGPDQFGRTQQKEFIGGTQTTDASGTTTIWEAKRTVVYIPSFFKRKTILKNQSSTEIQCYGQNVPAPKVQPIANPTPLPVKSDPALLDGF